MVNRPMQKRNKQIVGRTVAALEEVGKEALNIFNAPPVPVKQIETLIRYDVNQADLARWRNEGWQTVHYQFVQNDRDLPVLAVVMERVVEVESTSPPNPLSASSEGEDKTETAVMEEQPAIVGVPSVFEKLVQGNPIFAALCSEGIDAVTETMNEQVVGAVCDAMQAIDVTVQTTRFESRLLPGSVFSEEQTTIEVIQ